MCFFHLELDLNPTKAASNLWCGQALMVLCHTEKLPFRAGDLFFEVPIQAVSGGHHGEVVKQGLTV